MKRLVMDLDGTITRDDPARGYQDKEPNTAIVSQMRAYRSQGYTIVIASARNMNTYAGSVGLITANTVPIIIDWLRRHDIPYDELHVGKPWCGHEGFYVDDRAVRPSEFVSLTADQIRTLIDAERQPAANMVKSADERPA